jgi:hypothetical protein
MQNAHQRLGRLEYLRNTVACEWDRGQTFIPHLAAETTNLTWATVVSMLGLPADPGWGNVVLGEMRKEKRIRLLDGIGCKLAVINGTRKEFMARIGQACAAGLLPSRRRMVRWFGRITLSVTYSPRVDLSMNWRYPKLCSG